MNECKFYRKTYFLNLFAYFMYMGVLPPCMCWYPQMAEKSFRFPGTGVMDDCQLHVLGLKHIVLSTAESSLKLQMSAVFNFIKIPSLETSNPSLKKKNNPLLHC